MSKRPVAQQPRRVDDIIAPVRVAAATKKSSRLPAFLRARRSLSLIVISISFVMLLAGANGIIEHVRSSQTGASALQEVEREVGRHYLLPTNEQPALVTVEDESKVTSPFLKQAKNGDKILIYANAKIVIIYRPSIDRIVAVGPVLIDTSQASAQ